MSAAKAKKKTEAETPQQPEVIPVPRLKEKYQKEILPALAAKLGRDQPPRRCRGLQKIVVNMGVGKAIGEKKYMEDAIEAHEADHRPKAPGHAQPQVDRQLQAPRGHGHRLQGHACGGTACTSSSTG